MSDVSSASRSDDHNEDITTYPHRYYIGLLVLAGIYLLIGILLVKMGVTAPIWHGQTQVGYLVWELGAIHFLAGIRIVDANRIGGIFVLGWMTKQVTGTITLVPPLVMWLRSVEILTQEIEIPAEPQHIWREEGAPPADRPELRPPIRITFKEGGDQNDPLQRRVTEEVSFFVRLRVEDFFKFYIRLGSFKEARNQIEDIGVSFLAEVLPQYTLSEAITMVKRFSDDLQPLVDTPTDRWGIKVPTVRVKQFPLSKSLNTAIQKMSESSAEKKATIIESEGEQERLANIGKGTASAERAQIDARTEAYKRMAAELGVSGAVVLGVEAARTIGESPSSKLVVGAPGIRELASLGTLLAEKMTERGDDATSPAQTTGA